MQEIPFSGQSPKGGQLLQSSSWLPLYTLNKVEKLTFKAQWRYARDACLFYPQSSEKRSEQDIEYITLSKLFCFFVAYHVIDFIL